MSHQVINLVISCAIALAAAVPAKAVEIVGQIGAVEEKGVAVLVVGDVAPQVGDKFAVVIDVPGVGEARIAQGQLNALDGGIALGTITEATGKLAVGQKVKIDSPQSARVPSPSPNAALPAPDGGSMRALPGWGEIVNPAGDCRVVAGEDRLTIITPGTPAPHDLNPAWEYNNLTGPRVLREIEGDFQLEVQVRPYPLPAPNTASGKTVKVSYVGAGLLIWLDDKTFVRYLRAARGESGSVAVHLEAFQDGHSHPVVYLPGDARKVAPDQATYLRVERRNDELTFLTGTDGKHWTPIGSVGDLKLPRKLRCGVGVVNATTRDFAPEFARLALTGE